MNIAVRLRVSKFDPATQTHGPMEMSFTGQSEAPFREAASRAAREQAGWAHFEPVVFLDLIEPEFWGLPERFSIQVDSQATFAQVAQVFGDDLATTPARVQGGWGGRGGGDGALETVIELIPRAIEVGGYVSAAAFVWKQAVRLRYRNYRNLAKDWNDSGELSAELKQSVRSQPIWRRDAFDRCFALSASRGPELLLELGYERIGVGRSEEWVDHQWAAESGYLRR